MGSADTLTSVLNNTLKDFAPPVLVTIFGYLFDIENSAGIPEGMHQLLMNRMTRVITLSNGDISHWVDNKLHCTDGPALIIHGKDGKRTYQAWHYNGQYHRIGGPAIINANGDVSYYDHGELHCIDGPAVWHADGYREYCIRGKRHKLDRPAVVRPDGSVEYWIEGVQYSLDDFNAEVERRQPSC